MEVEVGAQVSRDRRLDGCRQCLYLSLRSFGTLMFHGTVLLDARHAYRGEV